jgi:electron transfer flavoprotein-quinone oxidoreductase
MPKVTAIVVGAGLAGLSSAYSLAKEGIDVLIVERGDYPGSKSISGGRMYFLPIRNIYPELWSQAPWERHVVKETLTLMSEHSSLSIEFHNQKYNDQPYHSFTVLASRFNRWFAQKVTEKGARIINKYKVDDLIVEDTTIRGVVVSGSKIEADVVIAADGVMSQIAEKASLRKKLNSRNFAVGVKEVIEIPQESLEKRFALKNDEGLAHLFLGSLTKGLPGGGFLYTNRDSVSLGIVLGTKDLADCHQNVTPYELLEEFKSRPEIMPLIQGGVSAEYSAHALAEGGLEAMPKLSGNGIIVVGDAAGMTMNLGLTVRGMDFAIASGHLAAKAVIMAKKQGDFSAASLAKYQDMLRRSYIWKDFTTFRHAPKILTNPRLFREYPRFACDTMEKIMAVGDNPKSKLSTVVFKQLKNRRTLSLMKDVFGLRKM